MFGGTRFRCTPGLGLFSQRAFGFCPAVRSLHGRPIGLDTRGRLAAGLDLLPCRGVSHHLRPGFPGYCAGRTRFPGLFRPLELVAHDGSCGAV